jgi:Sulfotransferase domain
MGKSSSHIGALTTDGARAGQHDAHGWSNEIPRDYRFGIRRVTATMRAYPDYIVIGAGKCGTTSMQAYLAAHPLVRAPLGKEVHYFDHHHARGKRWYRAHFPLAWRARPWLTGEATPYYLCHPGVPRRVARDLPDVKLIVLLRDPVQRAYSQYQMAREEYRCERLTFEEALRVEEKRLAGEHERLTNDPAYRSYAHLFFSYKERGRYAAQLERWFRYFDRDQILVAKSEDLFSRPREVLADVFAFLHLPAWSPESFPIYNRGTYADPMSEDAREHLSRYFVRHNECLGALLGWPVPIWR